MSASVDVSGTLRGLESLEAGILQAISLTMRSAVEAAEKSAQGTTRFRDQTGKTRQSIKGEWHGLQAGGFVKAGGASAFLENGTIAHGPKHARALRFVINGRIFYRTWVRGITARPFMAEARERGAAAADYGAEVFIGEAIRRAR